MRLAEPLSDPPIALEGTVKGECGGARKREVIEISDDEDAPVPPKRARPFAPPPPELSDDDELPPISKVMGCPSAPRPVPEAPAALQLADGRLNSVLARYEPDGRYYPAQISEKQHDNEYYSMVTVRYMNGVVARIERRFIVRWNDATFGSVPIGALPLAAPDDPRSLAERRALLVDNTPTFEDFEKRLEGVVPYLREIFDGKHPFLWRYQNHVRGTVRAVRSLQSEILFYLNPNNGDLARLLEFCAARVNDWIGGVRNSTAESRRLAIHVMVPEVVIRFIQEDTGLSYDEAEVHALDAPDKKRRVYRYSTEDWVDDLLAFRDDFAFGSAAASLM